jgi:hypothetical protein
LSSWVYDALGDVTEREKNMVVESAILMLNYYMYVRGFSSGSNIDVGYVQKIISVCAVVQAKLLIDIEIINYSYISNFGEYIIDAQDLIETEREVLEILKYDCVF